jgi:hypothetical protein
MIMRMLMTIVVVVMIDKLGTIHGTKVGRENRSTRGKPAPPPLRQPQVPHDLS